MAALRRFVPVYKFLARIRSVMTIAGYLRNDRKSINVFSLRSDFVVWYIRVFLISKTSYYVYPRYKHDDSSAVYAHNLMYAIKLFFERIVLVIDEYSKNRRCKYSVRKLDKRRKCYYDKKIFMNNPSQFRSHSSATSQVRLS